MNDYTERSELALKKPPLEAAERARANWPEDFPSRLVLSEESEMGAPGVPALHRDYANCRFRLNAFIEATAGDPTYALLRDGAATWLAEHPFVMEE